MGCTWEVNTSKTQTKIFFTRYIWKHDTNVLLRQILCRQPYFIISFFRSSYVCIVLKSVNVVRILVSCRDSHIQFTHLSFLRRQYVCVDQILHFVVAYSRISWCDNNYRQSGGHYLYANLDLVMPTCFCSKTECAKCCFSMHCYESVCRMLNFGKNTKVLSSELVVSWQISSMFSP